MTSHIPRKSYTEAELAKLYPTSLELQHVQILLRHGERSPVSARFANTGLSPFWPYCAVARQIVSATMNNNAKDWGSLQWRRRLETFGSSDNPVIASGPSGEVDAICNLGELTDAGRSSTHALGRRLRTLYVEQLGFMPELISDADMIYLRATPIPRALESLQEAFWGFYPKDKRAGAFPPPTIITRAPQDETLYPNDGNCRRFAMLSRAFAQRTADRWNETKEMGYVTKKIAKYMPDPEKGVAVDSHPRLSGIMDTINSTLAHGPETRLPKEFYDQKVRDIIEKVGNEEWFSGYKESREYRMLGIGGLMGDIVERMVGSVEMNGNDGVFEVGGKNKAPITQGRGGEREIKMGMSGCHDTTLAAVLASLGTFNTDKWPPYTSHIAIEMFREAALPRAQAPSRDVIEQRTTTTPAPEATIKNSWFGWFNKTTTPTNENDKSVGISRKSIQEMSEEEKKKLDGYYVRVRYNDEVMPIPGCKLPGNHLEGDESFCTLVSPRPLLKRKMEGVGEVGREGRDVC